MQADAYLRARKLLSPSSPNAPLKAAILGIVHSLLVLSLLVIAGLIFSLLDSQGEARFPTGPASSFPKWMVGITGTPGWGARPSSAPDKGTGTGTGTGDEFTLHRNTGLVPIVTGNFRSGNPLHRWGARGLASVVRRAPSLRNNV